MLTTDIKYAVGIDFGHGETSFSYYNITWGKDIAGQTDTITPTIQLLNGDKTIPSIYVYDRSKDAIYIGDEAADIYNIVGDHDNFVYKASFKKPISLMSDEEKSLFIKYMARVKIDLLKCCPKLQDEDPTNNIKSNTIPIVPQVFM
jgi:molecular chaperone DnaK (HSP70)